MTADLLSTPSRIFYEHSKFRMFLSIVFAGISLSFLGFAAIAGGFARKNQIIYQDGALLSWQFDPYFPATGEIIDALYLKLSSGDASFGNDLRESNGVLSGGYGFSAFCYFAAFVISLAASILISPYFGGSPNETKIINAPFEVVS